MNADFYNFFKDDNPTSNNPSSNPSNNNNNPSVGFNTNNFSAEFMPQLLGLGGLGGGMGGGGAMGGGGGLGGGMGGGGAMGGAQGGLDMAGYSNPQLEAGQILQRLSAGERRGKEG